MTTRTLIASFFLVLPFMVSARGGDDIRGKAPISALLLDARQGNEDPLLDAYFDDGIDYFLDIEAPQSTIARDLYTLRGIGRYIQAGDYASASNALQSLRRFEDHKIYLRGVLDAAQGKYEQSLESFRQLIDNRKVLSKHMTSLAFMGAARVFHEVSDYRAAIYHYNQVRQLESEFFEAVFEKSWSFYLDGDMNGALGASLTFSSPFFENAFYPEAQIVRAGAFFQLCYYDRANITVEKLKREYEPLRTQMQELLKRGPQSWLFEDRILKSVNPKILGVLTADTSFRGGMKAYLRVRDEVKSLRSNETNQVFAFLQNKLVQDARRVLMTADKNLSNILSQADGIQIDILQSGANKLLGQANEQTIPVKTIDLNEVDFDEMVQFWPFKGEFWVDELGSYYYGLKSNCEPS